MRENKREKARGESGEGGREGGKAEGEKEGDNRRRGPGALPARAPWHRSKRRSVWAEERLMRTDGEAPPTAMPREMGRCHAKKANTHTHTHIPPFHPRCHTATSKRGSRCESAGLLLLTHLFRPSSSLLTSVHFVPLLCQSLTGLY